MKDFSLKIYRQLLETFKSAGYVVMSFEQYCDGRRADKMLVLRHDVDLKAENSLETAKIENELGMMASYYFRVVAESNKPKLIREIVNLGHEVGYHYEDMSLCGGDERRAIEHFETWLNYFRGFYPVKTICMHGAPISKYDSKDIWKFADYREFGLIGEPYFDTDFAEMFYITDTGRCWDGYKVSVRDKIPEHQDKWVERAWVYHSTNDIIRAVKNGSFPKKLMMTTHPQRWTDNVVGWWKEFVLQNIKNVVKRIKLSLKK